jgi:amino acid transporter
MTKQKGEDLNPSTELLSEWHATAICGNDITSSCLYVSAYALIYAGAWGPLSLLLVAAVLWLFRGIYSEVVGALPLNGGAYNALLNTTSKFRASVAACLTILSYLATAVISAYIAVYYALDTVTYLTGYHFSYIQTFEITVSILFLFCILTIRGIGESSRVALAIFIFHLTCLGLLIIAGLSWIGIYGFDTLYQNMKLPAPSATEGFHPLLLGFCVAMLGISGFESSANFVEEQKPGVFPKTLRNMWVIVSIVNPLICFLALCVIPLGEVTQYKETLLMHLASQTTPASIGSAFSILISVDAALVLCGAVLTSFVGVTGLVHRMTLDRCLPQYLLKTSSRNTFYRIIFLFFLLASILLYFAGTADNLAGVYTISFLSVMLLFTLGNALLKIYRGRLPREVQVNWLTIIIASIAVTIAIIGNVIRKPEYVTIFAVYFIPTLVIVLIMLKRTTLLSVGIYIVRSISAKIAQTSKNFSRKLEKKIDEINSQAVVFFTRGDNIANLNEALLYVRHNEHTNNIKIVTVVEDESQVPPQLASDIEFLDKAYPDINIEFIAYKGKFSPELLADLSKRWNIPLNFMFIGSPGAKFAHNLSDLGGARLII